MLRVFRSYTHSFSLAVNLLGRTISPLKLIKCGESKLSELAENQEEEGKTNREPSERV